MSHQDGEIPDEHRYSAPKGFHSRAPIHFTTILFMPSTHQTLGQALGQSSEQGGPKRTHSLLEETDTPSRHSYITYVSTDHITAAKEKQRVFRWVIRVTQFRLRVQ